MYDSKLQIINHYELSGGMSVNTASVRQASAAGSSSFRKVRKNGNYYKI